MRGVVLCKLHVLNIVQDAGSVICVGGTENEGVRANRGYIYSSSCNFLV